MKLRWIQNQKYGLALFKNAFTSFVAPVVSLYLEAGGNIYDLQLILGHSSLEMVKKILALEYKKIITNFNKYSPLDNLKNSM